MNEHAYSNGVCKKKIAMLGVLPPPYGGVSVHIRRVADKLIDQQNSISFFSIERPYKNKLFFLYQIKLLFWLIFKRPEIIYYHGTYTKHCWAELLIIHLFSYLKKIQVIVVDHDCRHLYNRTRLFKWFYKKITVYAQIILIGDRTFESYQKNSIPLHNFSVENAFLPPVSSMASIIEETYPSSLFTFIKQFTPIILVNASHMMMINNKDVYGLELSLDMLAGIKNTYPDAGLIVAIADMGNKEYASYLYTKMKKLDIAEQVYILQNQKELWPLFKRVDLFVRPTITDGASISLQEADYFKVTTVASDICIRPKNCILFKSEDCADFIRAVDQGLQKVYHDKSREFSYSSISS